MPISDTPDVKALADRCLDHLAENPEDLAAFMGAAGYSPDVLRRAVGSRQLMHGLIDYFASNEPLLVAFCARQQMKPEAFMRVWHRLNPTD